MKKIVILLTLAIATIFMVHAQSPMKCCQAPGATATFALLSNDASFRNIHESPLPISYSEKGKMISYPTPDGKNGNAYQVLQSSKSDKYLIVFHEWWGLNDYIKREADMFSDSLKNTNVIAIDLYDGKVAGNADDAGKLMQSLDQKRAIDIVRGAINYLGKNAKIATVGWCFGGGWSLQGALAAGDQEVGCVMYYGMPESDVNKLKSLNSDVVFIWANKDKWINEQVKNDFISNMKAAGKMLTVKEYTADHAFANPSNPQYDQAATADAHKITMAYLKRVLQ